MPDDPPSYSVLLLGRTSDGKSSTGNSILGSSVFDPVEANTSQSIPHQIKHGDAEFGGKRIHVVDGSNIGDTGADLKVTVEDLIESLNSTIWSSIQEFNAIILVLKFGVRFTKQYMTSVELIKALFGEDVFKKWGVIVMTYGENFVSDNKDSDRTFEDWCKEQTGEFKSLFEEFNGRCLLFKNKIEDGQEQRERLVKAVDEVSSADGYMTYAKRNFEIHQFPDNLKAQKDDPRVKATHTILKGFLGGVIFLVFVFPVAYILLDYFKVEVIVMTLAFVCTSCVLVAVTFVGCFYCILRKTLLRRGTPPPNNIS